MSLLEESMGCHHRDESKMPHLAGDSRKPYFGVGFGRGLKLEFQRSRINFDAMFPGYRELGEVLGLADLSGARLADLQRGKNMRHLLMGLVRQAVVGRVTGYEDVNDAEYLSQDPVLRVVADHTYPYNCRPIAQSAHQAQETVMEILD